MIKKPIFICLLIIVGRLATVQAQTTVGQGSSINPEYFIGKDTVRVITTAMPFLTISPDARSGALGDAGVAISPDANSVFWNPAKLGFIDDKKNYGFALSYTPWLQKLVHDMSISYLSGYKKISKQEVVAVHLTYFNLGKIEFTDNSGAFIREFKPQEYSVGATYSRKLSDHLGVALTLKFMHSNLAGNLSLDQGATNTKPANAGGGDIGVYYQKNFTSASSIKPYHFAFGAMISNIGNKVSYTNNARKNFIPTSLRVGTAFTVPLDEYNKITFTVDLNKLMVPTPPLRSDSGKVISGHDDRDKSFIAGMLGSFTDAPNGFREEIKEIMISSGAEYWYNDLFAVRGGFFHENKYKGNRRYFTVGGGIRYKTFGLDFAYLIPIRQNNPLAETLRFTLHFAFQAKNLDAPESITE